ncbi:MAG: HisA/HisF-related TIM barrel protein [candidate division WOR-3 bacterium]|nr:HisA/HisF-related TIM barrel protein [candidate division WOR-3 bacterium]MCX7947740.1 HisA/HisF-related TIM barrel protein [candidate division WOR-3 bacterium]MDW8150337.1 geranylgeranylglyceryl/heptaprenylglyceryl phosphate synthase [candidate division WOR-3 bacterium]
MSAVRVRPPLLIQLFSKTKKKVILIDPDKWKEEKLEVVCRYINENNNIDFIFVGGSIIKSENFHTILKKLRYYLKKPIILFCGSSYQINDIADAFLIPFPLNTYDYNYFHIELLKNAFLISKKPAYICGYLLIGSQYTSAYIISRAYDISKNNDIILAFLKFSEIMKFSAIYLEAGSGSSKTIDIETIKLVSNETKLPIIVGGGLRDKNTIEEILNYANYVVVGNYVEENPEFVKEL